MRKILVVDNYDSFTYNLIHIIRSLGYKNQLTIKRNDKINLDEVEGYEHILLSPGPGLPKDSGLMPEIICRYGGHKNILGVCLGHQAIAEAFNGELYNLPSVFHGIVTNINLTQEKDELFKQLPMRFKACRYHSWVVRSTSIRKNFHLTSLSDEGLVMGIKHKQFRLRGVQFHPESLMTENGIKIMENWLTIC